MTFAMLTILVANLLLAQNALAAPAKSIVAATVGKIRGVRDPIYHLYLQSNPNNGMSKVTHPDPTYRIPIL